MYNSIDKFPIIFEEGPIARSYLQLFKSLNIEIPKIIYLLENKFFFKKISCQLQFNKNLYYPLKFLKDYKILSLIEQFEEYFNLENNFVYNMYANKDLSKYDIKLVNSSKINSNTLFNEISNMKEDYFLNTSKQIYKRIENIKNIIHIHPGYLPKVRGADGSLVGVLKYNEIGVSSFIMSSEIDKGVLIDRETLNFKNFKFNIKNYSTKDLYRIWYSFFDPLLRVFHLKKLIQNKKKIANNAQKNNFSEDENNYFSFLKEEELTRAFSKIYKDDK